jgi:uncharacterized membrane protein YccC
VAAWRAARVAVGVVLPLVVGWLVGHVDYGAYMALGALPAGVASFQGEARGRLIAVVLASIGMSVSTFVGSTVPTIAPWSLVPIVAVWAYMTGLSVCLGQHWSTAVLQWSVALLIAVGIPQHSSDAALRAGLVLAGGLFQAALVAAAWTVRPGRPERGALATSYAGLATYASRLGDGAFDPPPPDAFPAQAVLEDPNPLLARPLALTFVDLLEEAERIRASLAALATRLSDHGGESGDIRTLMSQAAGALDLIARALISARSERDALLRDLEARIAAPSIAEAAAWRWSGEALLGQLRAVVRMIADLDAPPGRPAPADAATARNTPREGALTAAFATLRANMTLASEAGRHAVRLAAVASLAETFVQAIGLYQGRWAVLTIFFVLKPDYASTLDRGAQRALGTALGAIAAAGVVELAHHQELALIAAAGIAIAIAYALFDASYLLFTVLLTMFIVLLLVLLGFPGTHTAEARIYDTFIGAAMALTAYVVWPTWHRTTAHDKFAALAEAHRDYGTALLGELAHPGSTGEPRLRALQVAARRARSDAEAAATRLADEPSAGWCTPETAHLLAAAIARVAHAELAIHALALSRDAAACAAYSRSAAAANVDALKNALGTAMTRIAIALRTLRPPEPIPALRPVYGQLARDPSLRDSALIPIVGRLVDAINTLDAIVRDRLQS